MAQEPALTIDVARERMKLKFQAVRVLFKSGVMLQLDIPLHQLVSMRESMNIVGKVYTIIDKQTLEPLSILKLKDVSYIGK